MSRQINTPINNVRLTNVATVRMNKNGKRFEIACYRNKVVNYRQGLETDLSEVLQTDRIFTNVSKGQFSNTKDLQNAFSTKNEETIAKIILEKGTLQVSDLERSQQYENMTREVATWLSNNTVHTTSQRPFTVPQIRQAMKQAEFTIHPTRSVKRQYLDCLKLLQQKQILPIQRAPMKLSLQYPVEQADSVQEALKDLQQVTIVETNMLSNDDKAQTVVLVDPSLYRTLDDICKSHDGQLEILQQVVRQEGDVDLELEMERKKQQKVEEVLLASSQMERTLDIDDKVDEEEESGEAPPSKPPVSRNDQNDQYSNQDDSNKNTRQDQKKANKKSKKAKRREKEEAAERQARINAERQRQEERAKTLGTHESTTNVESDTPQEEAKSCNTCGGSFPSASAYRAHFRSDWHRYNIKLKMQGVAPVTEQEFLLCDSDAFFEDM